nr:uncharacterized protein LOC112544375 [Pelodiscus sinensis]|eukprot:XP_025036246.1 uncharacterized protein LOC112544375 [Pelodiscus sinensis]
METLVPGRLPCSTLWMAALLLWLGTGALGDISTDNLHTIIQYIKPYGVNVEYAFAVSLPTSICRDPSRLAEALPHEELQNMNRAIRRSGSLYDPTGGHIVAAQVMYQGPRVRLHPEWRLLHGGQNSPVRKLLARTPQEKRCLIFFTRDSPCLRTCLRKNGNFNILPMVRDTFSLADNNYQAFVFQQIYDKDQGKGQELLDAWSELRGAVPLMRCDNNGCRNYAGDGTSNRRNPSMDGRPIVRRRLHPPGRGQ